MNWQSCAKKLLNTLNLNQIQDVMNFLQLQTATRFGGQKPKSWPFQYISFAENAKTADWNHFFGFAGRVSRELWVAHAHPTADQNLPKALTHQTMSHEGPERSPITPTGPQIKPVGQLSFSQHQNLEIPCVSCFRELNQNPEIGKKKYVSKIPKTQKWRPKYKMNSQMI